MTEDVPGIEVESFSALVAGIYDAALDPASWSRALLGIREFAVGQCATIFTKDVASHTGGVVYDDGGIDAAYRDDYFRSFIRLDPTFVAQYYARIGEPMATEDFLPYDEFVASRFYQEWARPQELVDFAAVALEKSSTSIAMFGVFRHERHGVVDEPMRARLRLVAPHVRRAVEIGRLLERRAAATSDFAETLDGLRTAVLLLDARGGLRHANEAAHALIELGTIFRIEHSRLVGATPEIGRLIRGLVGSAGDDLSLGQKGIGTPLAREGGRDLVVSVLPLSGGRRGGSGYGATVALMISAAGPAFEPAPPERVARRYNLTPAELRILLAITEFGGVPATAEALGIAQSTVKFHLKHLFAKTGTHRQAGLVRLLAEAAGSSAYPTRSGGVAARGS